VQTDMTLGNLLCPAYVRQLEGSKARERACNASLAAMAMAVAASSHTTGSI